MRGGRWKAAKNGGFASGNSDFTMGFGKPRNRISQKQDGLAPIAEVFGHSHGGPGTPPPDQGRLIGSGCDHNRARTPIVTKHFIHKMPDFPPAFTDHCNNDDVRSDASRKRPHQA